MCQLLGMNCNTPTDVAFSFTGFSQRAGRTGDHCDGWGIAFFEYALQVPANRIGFMHFDLAQLKITQEITQGKGTVGMLIRDTVMSKNLQETLNYLRITSKGTSESVASLNKLINELNRKDNVIGTLNDTVVANRMKKIIINLEKSSNEIDKVVTNLNATITNVKDGKGALNYLSNDPKLVKQIDSTITNINKASIKLNEDLEALKHNFLFRRYFKKQEKEKAKKKTN